MAKKKTEQDNRTTDMTINNPPILQDISTTLETNFMPYAMSVIVSRAIPEIDGFKPAHRKLLYTMYKFGLLASGASKAKSADVVGQTMRLNPHGDGAIYETLVRLTRGNDALLHPFIDSKGNFGKQYSRDMAYAASRYTECKLDGFCNEIFADIEKDSVDFIDNYNGSMKEPRLLPATFPNVLVTPNLGIAVGMASSICSFNLKEICHSTIALIKNADADISEFISGPDLSTGGEYIYNEKELANVIATGRGGFKLRGRWRYDKKASTIEIFEIPYTTTIEAIIDKIAVLVKSGKIKEVNDIRDETDLSGMKIAIDIKRAANPELLMQRLFSLTPLTDTFSCNFNVLIKGRPMTLGIPAVIGHWLDFRVDCIRRKTNFQLNKCRERLHLLRGLEKIILDIDKAIRIIRNTEEEAKVVPNLMSGFSIDEIQADYIAEIKLRNINKQFMLSKISELEALLAEIKKLEEIAGSDVKIKEIIVAELKEIIKKYGKPRRTEVIYQLEQIEVKNEDFIEDYGLKLFLTEHGYFKKISLASLRSSSEQYLKEDDRIVQEVEATNKSELLFFTSKQNVYKTRVHEFADTKASAIGEYLVNSLNMDADERVVCFAALSEYSGYMIFGFENGKVAKVSMEAYETKTNRKKLINAYSDKARLIFAEFTAADADYVVIRGSDKASLFSTGLINPVSAKNSQGVSVITLKKNSVMSVMQHAGDFNSDDIEYYRTDKIPTSGHFIRESDKDGNGQR